MLLQFVKAFNFPNKTVMIRSSLCLFIFLFLFSIPLMAQEISCNKDQLTIDTIAGPQPFTHLNLNNDRCQFQFAIVTDRTGGHRPGVFMDGVNKLNLLQPEFVMSVGDLIEGYTEDTLELERQWNEFEGFVDQLQMPFFYLPGNHDITNAVMESVYMKRFGRTYYHFIYKDVLFLCLNTEDQYRGSNKGTISDEQYKYIQQVLAANENVRWTLVFMHQPLWILEDTKRWNEVEQLLESRKHTVFVGHHHHYVKYERNNGKYFMLATTGGGSSLRSPKLGEFDHVVWVTMTDQGPILANLQLDGIWDENVVTEASQDFFKTVMQRNPVKISPLLVDEDRFTEGEVLIKVQNDENIPMQIDWKQSFSWSLKGSFDTPIMTIPPNSVDTLLLNIETRKSSALTTSIKPLPIKAIISYNDSEYPDIEMPFEYNIRPVKPASLIASKQEIVIDGNLDDWSNMAHVIDGLSEESLDVSFDLLYDEDYLYIAAKVQDDTLVVDTGEVAWRQDFIGFVVNGEPLASSVMRKGSGWYENSILFTIAPATNDLPSSIFYEDKLPEGTEYTCVANATSYILETAIPLSYIKERQGENWKSIRFNIIVQDRDGQEENWPRYYYEPNWRGKNNYIGSGLFFKDEKQ